MHNLQEEPNIEDIARTLHIYAALHGRHAYHQATMVEIEGNIPNASISIRIDPGAHWRYVAPKIVDICKLGKFKHDKPWIIQLSTGTKWKVS